MQQAFQCPKCGVQIPVGQYFCTTCGQHFEYRCRHCGAAVKTLSGFCTHCGEKLHQQTQPPTKPAAKKVIEARKEEKNRQATAMPQSVGHVGRYLILIAIITFMGTILYVIGTGPQRETSNWFGGSFIFGGQSPPSTPPNIDAQQEPEPGSDLPLYTTDQVIAEAKKTSPHCRVPTRRTGWVSPSCPPYEDAEPIFTAEYLGDGMWSIFKTCPINSEYNGYWYFFEDNGQLIEQY